MRCGRDARGPSTSLDRSREIGSRDNNKKTLRTFGAMRADARGPSTSLDRSRVDKQRMAAVKVNPDNPDKIRVERREGRYK